MDEKKVIDHFFHEHPLILRNVSEIVGCLFERGERVDCYGCGNPINETEMVYVCMQQECSKDRKRSSIYHKKCGESPNEISHPIHPHHPLRLFDFHSLRGHRCDVCRCYLGSMLGYRCSSCDFDLDITCEKVGIDALLEKRKNEVNHPSHPHHPLTLMRKPAITFYCHGCGERDTDMAYICSSCEFWVHKSCVLLPLVHHHQRHHHHLSLTFSFPKEHRKYIFFFRCAVCDKLLDGTCWAYSCADCRYYVHLKCATASSSTTKPAHSNLNEDNTGVVQLPLHVHDIYKKLLIPFVMRERGVDEVPFPETAENSGYHKHPLSLVLEEADEVMMICEVCVTPISSPPYYECRTCRSYFIHSICYLLPLSLQCLSPHDQDQLYGHCKNQNHNFELRSIKESKDKDVKWNQCNQCQLLTTGMWYQCDACRIRIDVKCASLPTSIMHASHSHLRHKPLVLTGKTEQEMLEWGSSNLCRGCQRSFNLNQSRIAYCCSSDDCDFALDLKCAQLPPSITKHVWENCTHPLLLTYGASQLEHPSDFICEFCENEMNPLAWMYHCCHCDISVHPDCLDTASGWFRNVRFGSRFEMDDIHPHPLTFNCITLNKWCRLCYRNVYTFTGFECESCYYAVCRPCGLLHLA